MSEQRPNILLIHCHDLGRFLGCYDVPSVSSPHLDRLAAEGTRFTSAFATAPQCSPARASLFTGRYPQQNGVLGLTHGAFGWDLHDGERHLAEVLGGHGYTTGLIGVHHESRVRDDAAVAARLGFDRLVTGGRADVVAERTEAELRQLARAGRPFYLQVGFDEPHRARSPLDPHGVMGFLGPDTEPDDEHGVTVPPYLRDDELARAEIAELQGSVRWMDHGVGRILAALRSEGLDERTIVVFTTDHGLALPRAKCTLYDPGIETTLIMRVPSRLGRWPGIDDGLVSGVDLAPTLLDLLGLPTPTTMAGRSLVPALDGAVDGSGPGHRSRRSSVYAQLTFHIYYDPRRCVRTARHKLIANFSSAPQVMDPSQSWNRRCIPVGLAGGTGTVGANPPLELYDLSTDPHELTNLAEDPTYAEPRADLLAELRAWMTEVGDPVLDGPVPEPRTHAMTHAYGIRRGAPISAGTPPA